MYNNKPPTGTADGEEQDGSEQIRWLRSLGDREALFQFMDGERQTERGLEAAEALVELGDVRGLDHLIATLRSTNSSLRHQAAQALKLLNHPRALRALRDFRDEPDSRTATAAGSKLEAPGGKLRSDLEALDTDELVALWHEKQHSTMSGPARDALSGILMERLGRLPPEDGGAEDRVDQDVDPRIQDLWIQGDTESLRRIFEDTQDVRLQLEVAEALADLGDDDALDVLIEALDDSDPQVNESAAEMLDWLDLPRGNQALEDRGIEFETGAEDLFSAPETRSVAAAAPTPPTPADPWAAAAQVPAPARSRQLSTTSPLGSLTASQPLNSAATSAGVLVVGVVGGVIGFILFRFALDLLGFLPLPADVGGWIKPPALYYLGASILVGAVAGTVGSRVAEAIGRRLGWEPAEGDLLPVFGALFEGATSAAVVSLLMYSILGF